MLAREPIPALWREIFALLPKFLFLFLPPLLIGSLRETVICLFLCFEYKDQRGTCSALYASFLGGQSQPPSGQPFIPASSLIYPGFSITVTASSCLLLPLSLSLFVIALGRVGSRSGG